MNTITTRLLATACLYLLALAPTLAADEGGYLILEMGAGEIDVDKPELLPFDPDSSFSDSAVTFGIGGGYLFPSGIYVDLAYTDMDTFTLFGLNDIFSISSTKLGVGYKIKTNKSFSFLAKVGLAFWDVDVTEGFFLNPGPELSGGFHGTDMFFEVGGEYMISDEIGVTLSHGRHGYDLGDATATRFGLVYFFGGR